jgi:hypothetical protein
MAADTQKRLVVHGRYALPLAGWDDRSVWGMDRMEATYGLFAQLWRNGDADRDNPRHWISEIPDLPSLCRRITAATGCTEDDVAEAMLVGLRVLEAEQGLTVFH